mmetsp:Transcript_37020/g.93521  ORF Transcript_37020/g.93521 Transcript_37020/m.93521 type:complete len:253 (+) Transcript_37020:231-989(+)
MLPRLLEMHSRFFAGRRPLGFLDGQEQLEFRRQLLLRVEAVREVDAPDATVCVDLHLQRLDVVRAVCPACKVGKVELNLVPALIQPHGHRANKGLHARGRLVVGGPEAAAHVLIIEHLDLESEVLLQVLDDHHQKRQLDTERLARVSRRHDVAGADVGTHDLQHTGLNVRVRNALDVAIFHGLVPDFKRPRADAVQYRQEAALEGVLEHRVKRRLRGGRSKSRKLRPRTGSWGAGGRRRAAVDWRWWGRGQK